MIKDVRRFALEVKECNLSSRLFSNEGYEPFEVAQIVNLCPESSEEAKSLIPRYN